LLFTIILVLLEPRFMTVEERSLHEDWRARCLQEFSAFRGQRCFNFIWSVLYLCMNVLLVCLIQPLAAKLQ